jgi:hypothetical protein
MKLLVSEIPRDLSIHLIVSQQEETQKAIYYEAEFRTQLSVLSDQDLLKLDPDILCAGLLDRAARIKKAYKEEMAERTLKL